MTIYHVGKYYKSDGSTHYQVLPYNLEGTIRYNCGIKSLLQFLKMCRLSEKSANRLKNKLQMEKLYIGGD